MTWFGAATDVALFYYVGHGQYDSDDRLCMALRDSSDDAVLRTTTSLPFDAVRHAFRVSRATTKIAILDCCFAGLADRDNALAGLQTVELPGSPGFYLMMASGEFSTAWCETTTENVRPQTYFTKYLADVIESGIPAQRLLEQNRRKQRYNDPHRTGKRLPTTISSRVRFCGLGH